MTSQLATASRWWSAALTALVLCACPADPTPDAKDVSGDVAEVGPLDTGPTGPVPQLQRQATLRVCPSSPASTELAAGPWRFTDVTSQAGLAAVAHVFTANDPTNAGAMLGAVAAGDVDGDCAVDLLMDRGEAGIALLRNAGDGTFMDITAALGVEAQGTGHASGTLVLADFSGDGALDIFVGGYAGRAARMLVNDGLGTSFQRVPLPAGLTRPTYGALFFDFDLDDRLDLFAPHWVLEGGTSDPQYLFHNDGAGAWTDATISTGLEAAKLNHTLTPRATDLNGDGYPDLLVVADFGQSNIVLSDGKGGFELSTPDSINDENGMGSATGDVDNDGDIDWFVSSIFDQDGFSDGAWGVSGNRMYLNDGAGGFVDTTDSAGVREGDWAWAACMQDLDNDGALDIFHGNGWPYNDDPQFIDDASRLWQGAGDGTFAEVAAAVGLDERGQGRGVACFDYDRDGDVDLFIANHQGPPKVYRNDGAHGSWLVVRLRWRGGNLLGVGARIEAMVGGVTYTREVGAGSNFMSHDPYEAHFGLGDAATVDRLVVRWPDSSFSVLESVAARQTVLVSAD